MVGSVMHFEEGEDLDPEEKSRYERLRAKRLSDLPGSPIEHNTIVTVEDYSQEMSVEILVQHREGGAGEGEDGEGAGDFFKVVGKPPSAAENGEGEEEEEESDSDDLCVVEEEAGPPSDAKAAKRKEAEVVEVAEAQPAKKARTLS